MSAESLPLAVIPFQARRLASDDEEEGELSEIQTPRNFQTSCSPFRLPDGWMVEEKPRPSSTASRRRVDRYYYEPGTGRKFRSLVSVQKYLMEGTGETKRVQSKNKNAMQAETQTRGSAFSFGLPANWIVEDKPRKYVGVIDRTYIEPKTGQRFRSLLPAQRYLGEDNGFTAKTEVSHAKKIMSAGKLLLKHGSKKQSASDENCCAEAVGKRSKVADEDEDEIYVKSLKHKVKSKNYRKSGSPKKISLDKDSKASMVDLSCPPAKVKWALSGGFWTPFLGGFKVSESVKQKWSDAFVSCIQDGGVNEPRY